MSNILIIKHGSLGDLIQANGAIKDIKEFNKNCKDFPTVLIIKEARMKPLTFKPFINLAEAIALAKETGRPVLVKP